MYDDALHTLHKTVFKNLPKLELTESSAEIRATADSTPRCDLNRHKLSKRFINFLPFLLFLYAAVVWVVTCIQESRGHHLLPYSTLVGLR